MRNLTLSKPTIAKLQHARQPVRKTRAAQRPARRNATALNNSSPHLADLLAGWKDEQPSKIDLNAVVANSRENTPCRHYLFCERKRISFGTDELNTLVATKFAEWVRRVIGLL
jgi:hypothetical protein